MADEIERSADAQLERDLARVTGGGPRRMALVGASLTAAGIGLLATGGGLGWMILVPFYFATGVGAVLMAAAAWTWRGQRTRAREEPPVPPARLLP